MACQAGGGERCGAAKVPYIVTWSPRAVSGIQKAYRFLAEKDADAAKAAAQALLQHADILEAFPNAGRPADEHDAAILSKVTGAGEPERIAGASGSVYQPGPDHSSKLAYRLL